MAQQRIFGGPVQIEYFEYGVRGPGIELAPQAPPPPAFSHLAPRSHGAGRSVLGAVETPADRFSAERRKLRNHGVDPEAAVAYLNGTQSAASLEPPPVVDERAVKLARAKHLLEREPDAERLLQAKVIDTFRFITEPAHRSQFTRGRPPVIRIACRMHLLRNEILCEPDAAGRIVLLVDAEAELRSMIAFNESDGNALDAQDRSTVVAQIGLLFGMALPGDRLIEAEQFFASAPTAP